MPRILTLLLVALMLSAPHAGKAGDAPLPDPSAAAVTFVSGFSDDHLSGMLSRIGARQPTLMAIGQLNGGLLASVFDAEIDKAVLVYGDAWRDNMARAWTPLLTDAELTSLTTAGAQSPFTDKYLALRGEAGQTMQVLSSDLFRQILSEVVANTARQLGAAPAAPDQTPSTE